MLTHEHAPKVTASLHITRHDPEKAPTWESTPIASLPSSRSSTDQEAPSPVTRTNSASDEKALIERVHNLSPSILRSGRPDVEAQIREAIQSTPKDKRVLVAACGPSSLMKSVRNTTAACISADGPSIELHLEQFGW